MGCQWVAKTQETSLFPEENGGTVEERLARGLALGLPNPPLGAHFPLKTNIIPWMGSNMPLESSTLAFKSHSNAHALQICGPNHLKPNFFLGKADVSLCILAAPGARNELPHLVSGDPSSTLGC